MRSPNLSRRAFLRGQSVPAERPPIRPPWSKPEAAFTDNCSRCSACLQACPENILVSDAAGFPKVDFSRGECTFCQACVQACEQAAFDTPATDVAPWSQLAIIGEHCFGQLGIYCRSCGDACEPNAIEFSLSSRSIPIPVIDATACTGCGACVASCPANVIEIRAGATLEIV